MATHPIKQHFPACGATAADDTAVAPDADAPKPDAEDAPDSAEKAPPPAANILAAIAAADAIMSGNDDQVCAVDIIRPGCVELHV